MMLKAEVSGTNAEAEDALLVCGLFPAGLLAAGCLDWRVLPGIGVGEAAETGEAATAVETA